jgi:hypothetical protein
MPLQELAIDPSMRPPRRWLVLPLAAVALIAAASPASAHVRTDKNLVPRHGALFGAFVNHGGNAWSNVVGFERQLGFRLTVVHHYRPWSITSFRIDKSALSHRQIPMISWSPGGTTTASAIANGSQDALITRTARAIKGLRKKIFLRLAYEMDQPPGSPRYIGTPSEFVPAWRHVVRIFRQVGARNARFVWCGIAAHFKTGHAQAYYPGDRYVNWIAADGYNWYPAHRKWTGYRSIFSSFYRWAKRHGKPLMIAETGSMEDPHSAGHKAKWMTRARKWVHAHHHLKAVVYFDSISPKGYDFRVQTSGSSTHAFRRWGRGSYWNTMHR